MGLSIFITQKKWTPSASECSDFMLVLTSKVILSCGSRRDSWPNFCSFQDLSCLWKWDLLFDGRRSWSLWRKVCVAYTYHFVQCVSIRFWKQNCPRCLDFPHTCLPDGTLVVPLRHLSSFASVSYETYHLLLVRRAELTISRVCIVILWFYERFCVHRWTLGRFWEESAIPITLYH
jgi:hypothetical protein